MDIKCPKCNTENPSGTKFCRECGTQLIPTEGAPVSHTKTLETPAEDLTRGSTFAGRYEVVEELGKGGMGKVYRVEDTKIKEEVALKLIKPEIASDKKTIERFRSELKIARKIRHKNVCGMYDLGEEKGTHYITMEYVPGEDLKSFIRRAGPLGTGKAIYIAKQVCEGLSEAHRLGVVHRDLKPSNIMIDREGNARIMDFGIARSLKAKGITGAGIMVGTPEYMSPEQAEVKEVDQRSDIYSLGVILYEMVTGRVPFEGETPLGIAMKHKSEMPNDPRELNPQVPLDLSSVILKCLEKDKENRYQSAGELRSELENIEKGIPTTERVASKKKPITSKEITVTFSLKKLIIPALVVAALIIIVLIIWQPWSQKQAIPSAPADKPSLAVMYFENNTGDENLDHWRKALSELLVADLSQSKFLRVLSGDRLFNILKEMNLLEVESYSSKDLEKVASRGGVENILRGSYTKAGDILRIDTMLKKVSTGELLGSEKVEGKGEEGMFSIVDELTRRIKADFKLSVEQIASDKDKEVGKITTSSPEAYKYYSEGRKFFLRGDYRQSIPFMEKAIAIDPEFAMAYRSMAAGYGNLGRYAEARKYWQKALEFSNRLSDKEQLIIHGDFYYKVEIAYDKAIDFYTKLLKFYPDNIIGNINLGNIYFRLEQWDKAKERYKKALQISPETVNPNVISALLYMSQGLYEESNKVIKNYINNFSDSGYIRQFFAVTYLCQGKYERALAEVDKAFLLDPTSYFNTWVKGDIELCRGNVREAEKEYQKLLDAEDEAIQIWGRDRMGCLYLYEGKFEESKYQLKQGIELTEKIGEKGWKWKFHLNLAYIFQKTGNPEKALKECNYAWNIAAEEEQRTWDKPYILYFKGRGYLGMKSINEARIVTDELKKLIERGMNRKLIRLYFHLIGMIELDKDNFPQAIENFQKSLALYHCQFIEYPIFLCNDHAMFMDPLAKAYYEAGNIEMAREEYEKIISLSAGRIYYGDIYAKSFYMLGKIYERKGQKGEAIENYEKFLDLWKDADAGLPEVDDAKERLTALKS